MAVTAHQEFILETLDDAFTAANRAKLDPTWTTDHSQLIFDCPQCKQDDIKQRCHAQTGYNGGLIADCNTCGDNTAPGIIGLLEIVGRPPGKIIPLHPEQNGNGTNPTSVRHHVTLLNLDELLANPPPDPDFAWGNQAGGYIELGTLCVLHGDGGLGKSLIGQGLCRRYTLGKEWLGQQCNGGIALYLDGENSLAEIARRLYSFEFRPGDENLKYGRVQFPILLDPAAGEKLMDELILDTGATLIVLDSQRALWGGDEREQLEVRPMYDMLARVAEKHMVAILLIHHDNKSGLYSGSTDINAAVVSRIHLERKAPKDRSDRRRILWHEKSRSGPEQEPVTFTVDKNWDGILTFEIHDSDTGNTGKSKTPGEARLGLRERVLDILSDRVPRTRSETAHALGIDTSNGTLRRTWNDLIEEGLLASSDNQHWTSLEGVAK